MSPNVTVNDGDARLFPSCASIISNFMSKPFSFSIISGWPDVILRFLAMPYPELLTRTPRLNGTVGSTTSIKKKTETKWGVFLNGSNKVIIVDGGSRPETQL